MKLSRVGTIGLAYFHRFENDNGEKKIVQTTKEEYEALGTVFAKTPVLDGWHWRLSYQGPLHDTMDGLLSPGQYADALNGNFIVNVGQGYSGDDVIDVVPPEQIVDGVIDDALVEKIKRSLS